MKPVASRESRRGLLARLGKRTRGKERLHVRRLGDVDGEVLEAIARVAVTERVGPGRPKRR